VKTFPKDFLWGSATSAHQVEGGNFNDWTEWERANAERLAKEAESKYAHWVPVWDDIKVEATDPKNYISGRAADHYHRFEEDFDIAKSLGHNAHRLSIEWSRIEPEEGRFNEKEIEHYRKVIQALRERGIEPFVTLWHWTIPLWVRDRGGVESKTFPRYFARYTEYVVERLKNEVKFWMTLNEPTSVIVVAYLRGEWPPQKKSITSALRVFRVLAQAHNEAYRVIKQVSPVANVGFGNIMSDVEPFSSNPLDHLAARFRRYWSNRHFLRLTGLGTHDFFALQYYFHERIQFPRRIRNENKKLSDMGWELYPEGLYHLLTHLKHYKKPIYITENGLADARDTNRGKFIKEHLRWVHKAIEEGVDVRGYFYWSLLDNFEWDKGFWPRFGLVSVDYKTLKRAVRPSAWTYAKIAKTNTLDI